jgi:hypothetical protein
MLGVPKREASLRPREAELRTMSEATFDVQLPAKFWSATYGFR